MAKLFVNCTFNRDGVFKLSTDYYEMIRYGTYKLQKEMKLGSLLKYISYKLETNKFTEIVLYGDPLKRKDMKHLLEYLSRLKDIKTIMVSKLNHVEPYISYLETLDKFELIAEVISTDSEKLLELTDGDTHNTIDVLRQLQNSTISYRLKLPLMKYLDLRTELENCSSVKSQCFILSLPLLTGDFSQSVIETYCYSKDELYVSLPDILSVLSEYQNNTFYVTGLPMCWLHESNCSMLLSDNIVIGNPLQPNGACSSIQPGRVLDFASELRNVISVFDGCDNCKYCKTCDGIYNYMVDIEYVPTIIKEEI